MTKTKFVAVCLAALLSACGPGDFSNQTEQDTQAEAAGAQPNFIVIVLDDWGWKDLGSVTKGINTPNMDAIAERGFVFENAFLTTSSCSPSRASILMGRYPTATGAPHLHDAVPRGFSSIPEELKKKGYYSESVGKWHLGGKFTSRFDVVQRITDRKETETRWLTAIKERPTGKPFFMWFSSFDPHVPHDAPEEFRVHDPESISLPEYLVDTPDSRQAYAAYLDEIHRVDYFIGQLIGELQAQNLLESTWLFIIADNGAPTPFAKTTLYDTGIKTPMLVLGPVGEGRYSGLVSAVDLAPTIVELVGLDTVPDFQGKSFATAFSEPGYQHRDYIFAEQNHHGKSPRSHTAVRSENHLLIRNHFFDAVCANEMSALWRDIHTAYRQGTTSPLQSICISALPPVQFFEVGGEGYEAVNLAGNQDYAIEQKRLEQALNDWEQQYRLDACPDIECARAIGK